MTRILVTGAGGFVGQHLAREIDTQGYEVDGVTRENTLPAGLEDVLLNHITCDLTDADSVSRIDFSPYQAVINLAGKANVGESYKDPDGYRRTNVQILSNICRVIYEQKQEARVIAVSSGAVYDSFQAMPLREDSRTTPESSPYASSKLAMEEEAKAFSDKGVDCVIARPFNHIGPGQGPGFLIYNLCHQLLARDDGKVVVGNMDSRRDYSDVRDVVRAYVLLALAEKETLSAAIYNICSGVSRSGMSVFDEIQSNIPGSKKAKLVVDQALIRPNDPPELLGSHNLITQATGWEPKIPFSQTVRDVVDSVKSDLGK